MSAFAEFLLIAAVLYVWESTLWLPRRGVALRKRWSGEGWSVLDPTAWVAFRKTGLIPMLPLPPDVGLAPCQGPPLLPGPDGSLLLHVDDGRWINVKAESWEDLREDGNDLVVGGCRTRLSSRRWVAILKKAREQGRSPWEVAGKAARLGFSPSRADREWQRWRLVSGNLRWAGLVLALGFFAGLPLIYLRHGGGAAAGFAFGLWLLMVWISAQLWWLGKRPYRDARSALRMDALLALLVPFHAMRALEIASVHAMATTHPVALLIAFEDEKSRWLQQFMRRLIHVKPGEQISTTALKAVISPLLARRGKKLEDFDSVPDGSLDSSAEKYCPRCHGRFLEHATDCGECHLPLRKLASAT